jgi:uncharacterized protein YjgD (DUF1641 family)
MNAQSEGPQSVEREVGRVVEAARDALTDEMISRLSSSAGDAVELMDQVTRSGLGKAIPALAQMVHDGDLDRLGQLARVYSSAQDSLSDEMIGRLSEAIGEGLSLLDQINRAGLDRAIPAIAEMVNNGDLNRLVKLARVYGSAEDALTDEMIGRLTETVGTGLSLLDRFNRGGADRVIAMLEHLEGSGALERLASTVPKLEERLSFVQDVLASIDRAVEVNRQAPPVAGGISGLWQMLRDPETQETLRFMLTVGKELRRGLMKK